MRIYEEQSKGVKYINCFLKDQRSGVLTVGDKKIVLNGAFKITTTKNSYKYGSELQFQIFAPKTHKSVIVTKRNKSNWDTTEINLPFEDIDEIIDALVVIRRKMREGDSVV